MRLVAALAAGLGLVDVLADDGHVAGPGLGGGVVGLLDVAAGTRRGDGDRRVHVDRHQLHGRGVARRRPDRPRWSPTGRLGAAILARLAALLLVVVRGRRLPAAARSGLLDGLLDDRHVARRGARGRVVGLLHATRRAILGRLVMLRRRLRLRLAATAVLAVGGRLGQRRVHVHRHQLHRLSRRVGVLRDPVRGLLTTATAVAAGSVLGGRLVDRRSVHRRRRRRRVIRLLHVATGTRRGHRHRHVRVHRHQLGGLSRRRRILRDRVGRRLRDTNHVIRAAGRRWALPTSPAAPRRHQPPRASVAQRNFPSNRNDYEPDRRIRPAPQRGAGSDAPPSPVARPREAARSAAATPPGRATASGQAARPTRPPTPTTPPHPQTPNQTPQTQQHHPPPPRARQATGRRGHQKKRRTKKTRTPQPPTTRR